MTKEELLKHYRHSLEVYQGRLADSEEDKFYMKFTGTETLLIARSYL